MRRRGFTPLQILKDSLLTICKLRSKDSDRLIDSHKKFVTGFTILELWIVFILLCVLVFIALPQYIATIEKARSGEAIINVGAIRVALDRHWYENGSLPANNNFSTLDIDDPNVIVNKLYVYTFADNGTTESIRKYTVTATRIGSPVTWVKWVQTDNFTGKLTRSPNLTGADSLRIIINHDKR